MSTLDLIQDILRLSGPFMSNEASERHKRWLEGLGTEKLLARRQELLDTDQRPVGQKVLRLQ